jgi:Zn finger protein HypA/HybF involved in hydrogenase expression
MKWPRSGARWGIWPVHGVFLKGNIMEDLEHEEFKFICELCQSTFSLKTQLKVLVKDNEVKKAFCPKCDGTLTVVELNS